MNTRVCAFRVTASAVFLLAASAAHAQGTVVPPTSLVGRLIDLEGRVIAVTEARLGVPDPEQLSIPTLARLIPLEVATTPFGTSTGGFTFTFDNRSGTFTRSTESFGPSFGKRSLTSGRGRVSAGFNWLYAGYDSLQGLNLKNGDYRPVRFATAYSEIKINLSSHTVVGFVSYGVTNDFEIGLGVPWIRISLDADVGLFNTSTGQIIDDTPGGHLLVLPRTSAQGVGDVAVFGKYRFWHKSEGGLAAEIEVRLPSGDTNSLRGSGITRTNMSAIFSRGGRVSPHANVGYELWSRKVRLGQDDEFAKDQITYGFGLEFQTHSRVTAIVDVIGRRQLHGGESGYRAVGTGPFAAEVLAVLPKALDVVYAAPGVKWNVAGNVLLTGNFLTAIANKGLRANVIPVVGLEWTF